MLVSVCVPEHVCACIHVDAHVCAYFTRFSLNSFGAVTGQSPYTLSSEAASVVTQELQEQPSWRYGQGSSV